WDVLFGTARITRRRPVEFGIENLPPMGLVEEFVWPQSMLRRR
ncbi:MAG: fatty acid hydroxylase, partial [Myxococcota bacterium]